MAVDLEERSVGEQLKTLAKMRGYTMRDLGDEFNRRFGTSYLPQSFSRKLKQQNISWVELKQFGEILGFKTKLVVDE